jgi:hypothetical protein
MKSSMRTFAAGIVATMMLFASCAKDGKTGPQGATGPQGPAGTNGTNGVNGTNGTNGNANVISTNTVNVTSWTQFGTLWTATITAVGITQAVVDKGVVMVFLQYGNQWVSLPDINGINSMSYDFSLGQVELLNANSDGTLPTIPTNPNPTIFRLVIIPASVIIKGVNMNNYHEVKAAYNLKD